MERPRENDRVVGVHHKVYESARTAETCEKIRKKHMPRDQTILELWHMKNSQ